MERTRPPQRLSLFAKLTPVQRTRLLSVSVQERLSKGQTLFRQGEPAKNVWVVLEGWVHLIRSHGPSVDGDGVVIFTITPEEMLCGLSAMEAKTYHTTAVAATPCRALRIPAAAVNEALAESPAFAEHVLRLCLRRIRHIAQQYGSMAEPVWHRIIRALLRLREQFGDTIPMTHRELAQMAWTSTETAIRVVRQLKLQGCLAGDRGRIVARDPQLLQRLLAAPEDGRRMTPVIDHGLRPQYAASVRQPGRPT